MPAGTAHDVTRRRRRGAGIASIVLSSLGIPFFGLMALLSANPCGAFGDACDDVGGTGTGFGWFVMFTLVAIVTLVIGIALVVTSRQEE